MKKEDIFAFIKTIEPIEGRDGAIFRCAAVLVDGTFLPCVVIQEAEAIVKLAMRRFDETRGKTSTNMVMDYKSIVKNFVCGGNKVNDYDIRELQISPYAIPIERLKEIKGETSMSWTEFTAEMDDGKRFIFGTTYLMEFFNMPSGYTAERITKIIPSEMGKPQFRGKEGILRERPFFICYI